MYLGYTGRWDHVSEGEEYVELKKAAQVVVMSLCGHIQLLHQRATLKGI